MQTTITTDRLLVTPLTIGHSAFIFELVNTTGWLKFIQKSSVNSEAEANTYVENIINSSNIHYRVVWLKDSNLPIGIISFIKRDYLSHHDIGFALLPEYGNNGYAYEAAKAVLNHENNSHKHSRILGITRSDNFKATRLLEKLGLEFDGEVEVEDERLQLYAISTDKLHITQITQSFFSVFTNKGPSKANLELLNQICISQTRITNKKSSEVTVYDLPEFIESRTKILNKGRLKEFEEIEIHDETKIVNNIAHRYSEYEKKGILDGKPFSQKGFKLLRFVKIEQSWKISSIISEDSEI